MEREAAIETSVSSHPPPTHTTPPQVARALVALHAELRAGVTTTLDALLAAPPPPLTGSLRQTVDRDGGGLTAGAGLSSSSDDGMSEGEAPPLTPAPRAPAMVDEDGFTTVVRRGRR